jgi:hypothetical protein
MKLMTGLYPIRNESIRSFLIRLAVANDYDMANHLLSEYHSGKHVTMSSGEESLISEAYTLMDIGDKSAFLPISTRADDSSNRLGHHAITQRNPQVCAECMTTQNHTDAHWQLYPITHCHLHQKRLLSHCVCCDEALVWDQDLLSYGCCHCDASWQQISAKQQTENVPSYIQYFHQLLDAERGDFLEDLLTACMRALRPYDSVHHGIKQLPHCDVDWSILCSQAFALLTDREIIEQWCQSMVSVRGKYAAIGSGAVFYPLNTLQARLHQTWLVHGFKATLCNTAISNNILPFHYLVPSNARNNAIANLDEKAGNLQLIHHIDQSGFSQLLGCDIALARKLFKIPLISSLSPVGRGHFSFIDIREFIEQTEKQNTGKISETIPLTELNEIFDNYMMSAEDVLAEIYQHQLPIYVVKTAKTLLEAIMVNEEVIGHHLETTYLKNESVISLTRTAHILKIPRDGVKQLGALGLLEEVASKPFTHDYTGASIASFLKSYECIERWSHLNGLCCGKVIKSLNVLTLKPDVSPFIFKRTARLTEALKGCLGNRLHAQEQLALF